MLKQTRLLAVLLVLVSAATAVSADSHWLDKYNVVWDTPSKDHNGSMPIGNGEIGLNLWVEPGGEVVFYIARTDAWSGNGRLLKLGRVRVRLDPPLVAQGHARLAPGFDPGGLSWVG